jgi:hypothetical protein
MVLMRQITQEMISALAANATAAVNAKKISQKGGFVRLEASADETFYWGECTGSGSKNYITSVDFLDPDRPVFRCTCPSRQIPCKHNLALLYEMMTGKTFSLCEVPEDILEKRQKKEAKAAAKAAAGEKKEKAAPKVNKAARVKKLKKQLEGLDLLDKLTGELVTAGLGTMGGTALASYRNLTKQLGDHYLPGPQRLFRRLVLEIEAFQKDGEDRRYDAAIQVLERLRSLSKKSRAYLSAKVESGDAEQDDSLLFEELGGIWKLSELIELGLGKERPRLCQLAFWVLRDEAAADFVDTGCWMDLDTGELSLTQNYRPFKAVKFIKQDDSLFGVVTPPVAAWYPGEGNRRVRWDFDTGRIAPYKAEDYAAVLAHAAPALAPEVKIAKGILKDPLAEPLLFRAVKYDAILRGEEGVLVLRDPAGDTILLGDAPGMEPTTQRLPLLPDASLWSGNALLGGFWYDRETRRMMLQPVSILTDSAIVRLLY